MWQFFVTINAEPMIIIIERLHLEHVYVRNYKDLMCQYNTNSNVKAN